VEVLRVLAAAGFALGARNGQGKTALKVGGRGWGGGGGKDPGGS
jgi:hypothetical protein